MNAFDKIIFSKLEQASDYTPKPAMWDEIEQELTTLQGSTPNGSVGFWGGIAASVIFGILFTQLPDIGALQPSAQITESSTTIISVEANEAIIGNQLRRFKPQEKHEIELLDHSMSEPLSNKDEKQTESVQSSQTQGVLKEASSSNELASTEDQSNPLPKEEKGTIQPAHDLRFKAIGIQCAGESVAFEAIGTYDKVEWLFDGIDFSTGFSASHRFTEAGAHQVMMIAYKDGARLSKVREIEVYDLPSPILDHTVLGTDDCFKAEVELAADPGSNLYAWSYEGNELKGARVTIPLEDGYHDIQLRSINEQGCVSISQTTVQVSEARQLFIPKAFSPGNDGKNDVWFPEGLQLAEQFEVNIYDLNNRNLVYGTKEIKPWNGDIQGLTRRAQRGEKYIYEVIATDQCGNTIKRDGMITVF